MKKNYSNALHMMTQSDEELSKIINDFVNGIPKVIQNKINSNKTNGKNTKDDKVWVFEDVGDGFSVTVGKPGVSCKDIMSLYLTGITDEQLKCWPRDEGEKLIGYFTMYLYNKEKPKEKPLRLSYDFIARRIEKNIIMSVTTNVNVALDNNHETMDSYGLTHIHERIVNSHYVIDANKILQSKCR